MKKQNLRRRYDVEPRGTALFAFLFESSNRCRASGCRQFGRVEKAAHGLPQQALRTMSTSYHPKEWRHRIEACLRRSKAPCIQGRNAESRPALTSWAGSSFVRPLDLRGDVDTSSAPRGPLGDELRRFHIWIRCGRKAPTLARLQRTPARPVSILFAGSGADGLAINDT